MKNRVWFLDKEKTETQHTVFLKIEDVEAISSTKIMNGVTLSEYVEPINEKRFNEIIKELNDVYYDDIDVVVGDKNIITFKLHNGDVYTVFIKHDIK